MINIIILEAEYLDLPDLELPDFVLEFLMNLKQRGRKYNTYVRYAYYIADFLEWIKERKKLSCIRLSNLEQLQDKDYILYFKQKGYQELSLKRIVSVLNQLCLFYCEKGYNIPTPILPSIKYKEEEKKRFVSPEDYKRLTTVMSSTIGLTDYQKKGRRKLINRNLCIVMLFYKYGLTLQELVSLRMNHIQLGRYKQMEIAGNKKRVLDLDKEDGLLILRYLNDIPKTVRPKYHSDDPLFVAFDYQRLTYRWVYDDNDKIDNGHPKALSSLAVQKMILQEVRRAGLEGKGISAQTMRNSAIKRAIESGKTEEEIMEYFGLKSELAFKKYANIY